MYLADLNLTDAPVGRIFDAADTDRTIEEQYFSQWRLPLWAASSWGQWAAFQIEAEADGRRVLDQRNHAWNAMISGDIDWQDYTVAASVRLLSSHCRPPMDQFHETLGRAGLVARYQTTRHYYALLLGSDGVARLQRRDNNDWTTLASIDCPWDRQRYVNISLAVSGTTLTATVDGESFSATDTTYTCGPAGILATAWSRYDAIAISADAAEQLAIEVRRDHRLVRERALQAAYPEAVLAHRIPKPEGIREHGKVVGPSGSRALRLYDASRDVGIKAIHFGEHPLAVAELDGDGNGLDELLFDTPDEILVYQADPGYSG